MANAKPQFGAVPNRALWDDRVTDRDVRILGVIASFDRLSGAIGKGQGAWASHATMAMLAGAEYSRFSVSINKLLGLGYLIRQALVTDRRKFTYRVVYTEEDRLEVKLKGLPQRKELPSGKLDSSDDQTDWIVCPEGNEAREVVCSGPELSDCDQGESDAQYISRSEVKDSVKTGEIDTENQRTLNGASLGKTKFKDNIGAQLANFERAWKSNPNAFTDEQITEWYNWLFEHGEDADPQDPDTQRAKRLYYAVDIALWEAKRGLYAAGGAV